VVGRGRAGRAGSGAGRWEGCRRGRAPPPRVRTRWHSGQVGVAGVRWAACSSRAAAFCPGAGRRPRPREPRAPSSGLCSLASAPPGLAAPGQLRLPCRPCREASCPGSLPPCPREGPGNLRQDRRAGPPGCCPASSPPQSPGKGRPDSGGPEAAARTRRAVGAGGSSRPHAAFQRPGGRKAQHAPAAAASAGEEPPSPTFRSPRRHVSPGAGRTRPSGRTSRVSPLLPQASTAPARRAAAPSPPRPFPPQPRRRGRGLPSCPAGSAAAPPQRRLSARRRRRRE